LERFDDFSLQLANLTAERNRPKSKDLHTRSSDRQFNFRDRRSRSSDRCSNSRSDCSHRCPSRHDTANTFCWYHQLYGDRAQRSSQPHTYGTQGKPEQQTAAAEHVCTTATGRLFITDKSSKRRFLIDTSSDLCVFPRKLIPQRRTRVNYDFRAANSNTIPTYV
jgi:hypothetical protein